MMLGLLFFRNRWLVCLNLCNGKSWWVPSCSLWLVKCSVNAVHRAVDPLILLYVHCVYGVCLDPLLQATQDSSRSCPGPQRLIQNQFPPPYAFLWAFCLSQHKAACYVCVLRCRRDGSLQVCQVDVKAALYFSKVWLLKCGSGEMQLLNAHMATQTLSFPSLPI